MIRRLNHRTTELLLFFILLAAYVYVLPRWAEWSQNSRLNLTLAIVDQGTLRIDDYYQNTGDYAKFEGHYYTDKAPGPSFLGVPVYAVVRPFLQSAPAQSLLERISSSSAFGDTLNEEGTGLQKDKIYHAAVLTIVTFFVSAIPTAVLAVLLFRFFTQIGVGAGWSASAALIYGLATPAFTYGAALFSHQLCAFLLFGAFYIGFQILRGTLSPRWVLAAGFMLAYSLISEYPTFLIAAGVFLYIVYVLFTHTDRRARRWVIGLVLAGLPPGLLLMAYNYAIFRTPLPVGYQYSELYTDLHSTGFLSLTSPHFDALWGISFSTYRGLFFVAPVLLLGVYGLWLGWRERERRAEWTVCIWAVVSFFLFNGSSVMWEGGFSVGPRYLVPMLPFLAAGLGAFARRWGAALLARALTALLTVWSVFVVWAETIGGQNYPGWNTNPLFEYSLPNLAAGDVARNLGMVIGLRGLVSMLPLAATLLILIGLLAWNLRAVGRAADTPAGEVEPQRRTA